ncbi:MAG: hypothetical protein LLF75_09570 [Eubacteriales bacterium]|nr:hypothetical protein [Eubacteriales bacterium]
MDDEIIFRKVAMERLSSPENLDQVMRVVPARSWIALVCLFVFAATAAAWACFGEIVTQVEGRGLLLQESGSAAGKVVAALSAGDGQSVRPGMEAIVSLDSGETLTGKVASISNADGQTLVVDGVSISKASFPGWVAGAPYLAVILPLDNGGAQEAASARQTDGAAGRSCTVQIAIRMLHPIQMILPGGAEKSGQ